MLTVAQREMLLSFHLDGEATDYTDFYDRTRSSALAWRNRERVIDALYRNKLLDENGITEAGRKALGVSS